MYSKPRETKETGWVIFSSNECIRLSQVCVRVKLKLDKKLQQNQATLGPTRLCDYLTITSYYRKWSHRHPFSNKRLLSNKRPLIRRPSDKHPVYNRRPAWQSKIIQFIQFLVWLTRVWILSNGKFKIRILTNWSLNGLDISMVYWMVCYLFAVLWYICRKHVSFVEFVTVMTINASYPLNTLACLGLPELKRRSGRLLGHLRYVILAQKHKKIISQFLDWNPSC